MPKKTFLKFKKTHLFSFEKRQAVCRRSRLPGAESLSRAAPPAHNTNQQKSAHVSALHALFQRNSPEAKHGRRRALFFRLSTGRSTSPLHNRKSRFTAGPAEGAKKDEHERNQQQTHSRECSPCAAVMLSGPNALSEPTAFAPRTRSTDSREDTAQRCVRNHKSRANTTLVRARYLHPLFPHARRAFSFFPVHSDSANGSARG